MKKNLLLLFLLGMSITFTNCNKDETEDLTVEITGEYVGTYGSNPFGEIIPYEVIVDKIDDNHISVKPKTGSEFDEFEIELERSNSSTIISPTDNNQQLDKSLFFTIGIPIIMNLSIDPTVDAHTFVGEKQ